MTDPPASFVLCLDDTAYPAALERRKVYRVLRDPVGEKHGMLRVVDESGEDYLYPARIFVPIEIPSLAKRAFAGAT